MRGVNSIDYNVFIKEEDLDNECNIIDFEYYLSSTIKDTDEKSSAPTEDDQEGEQEQQTISNVVEQKNYQEELNRHKE